MRFSVLGFNQAAVIEAGLDITDIMILQYIQQACGAPNMDHKLTEDKQPEVWISHSKFISDLPILNISEKTLRNKLSTLKQNGFLHSQSDKKDKGRGTKTYYGITELTMSLTWDMKDQTTSREEDMVNGLPCPVKRTSNDSILHTDSKLSNDISIPKRRKIEYTPEFEEFWKSYPRREDKEAAYNRYKSLLKDGYTHEELISSAKNYAEKMKKEHRDIIHIKHPATFLSAKDLWFKGYITKELSNDREQEQTDFESPTTIAMRAVMQGVI